jgi:hypothetical protein
MKNSMDMKSLPKLGQEARKKRGQWSIKEEVDKAIKARNAHESRQIARYTQKSNVQSARATLEEQRARIRKARRSGRGHSELKRPFDRKIRYKGDRDDRY